MTPDALFSVANAAVLAGWALLVFLPRWKWTARLVAGQGVRSPWVAGLQAAAGRPLIAR